MTPDNLEKQKSNPPREWVKLREKDEDSFSEGEYAKGFCSYISKFYWRPRDEEPDELHVVFREDDGDARYRYFGVPKEEYDEFWRRAYFPEEYNQDIGNWFFSTIRNEYDNERYKN